MQKNSPAPGGTVGGAELAAALDLAAAFGVRAIAVVSSDEKEEVARRSGAAEGVRSDGDWLADVIATSMQAGPSRVPALTGGAKR